MDGQPLERPAPRILNIVQFAREIGGTTDYDVMSHIHAGLRCAPQTKTYARWNKKKLADLQRSRDETRAAYRAAIAAGEIQEPPPDSLEETAKGHPDLASTQAAIRVLAKRAARRAAAEAAAKGEASGSSADGGELLDAGNVGF